MARILVIEDDGTITHVLRLLMEIRGHEVLEASDGSRGVATAQRQSPDVILLDLMMPTMDGFMALEALGKEERTAHVPVLVLSTLDGQDVQQRCYELGAKRYLRKPFDAEVLIGALEELSEGTQEERTGIPEDANRRRSN
ncbi:MAG: response regulator [Actinomycetota bacterium]|nr:response regulator [Actinomycetota bacterium]